MNLRVLKNLQVAFALTDTDFENALGLPPGDWKKITRGEKFLAPETRVALFYFLNSKLYQIVLYRYPCYLKFGEKQ
jgi:hypothetical protein